MRPLGNHRQHWTAYVLPPHQPTTSPRDVNKGGAKERFVKYTGLIYMSFTQRLGCVSDDRRLREWDTSAQGRPWYTWSLFFCSFLTSQRTLALANSTMSSISSGILYLWAISAYCLHSALCPIVLRVWYAAFADKGRTFSSEPPWPRKTGFSIEDFHGLIFPDLRPTTNAVHKFGQ